MHPVYHNPDTLKVAEGLSDPPINFLSGTVSDHRIHLGPNLEILLNGYLNVLPAGNYHIGMRSNHLSLSRRDDADIEIHAKVVLTEINGSETFIHLSHNDSKLVVQEAGILSKKIGDDISVYVNPGKFFVYNEAGALVGSPSSGIIEERLN